MFKTVKVISEGFIFVLIFMSAILAFAVLIGEMEKSEEPEPCLEFSPKQGVTCVKTGYGIGCWKD